MVIPSNMDIKHDPGPFYHHTPTPPPQQLVQSPNFPPQYDAVHNGDPKLHLELLSSPQLDDYSAYAPSTSPSVASVHSHHSHHSIHSIHSIHSHHGIQSPHFGPAYTEPSIPTYHGRQGSFAGFVGASPITSPTVQDPPYIVSPLSPYGNASFGQPFVPVHGPRRVSVSSVASSHQSLDWPEAHGTPDSMMAHMGRESSIHEDMMDSMAHGHMSMHGHDMLMKHRHSTGGESPPAWSDLKTKAGKDRKRLPLACIACRRKKIRCSGQKPACKHCLRSRIPCVYKVNTRKATPRTDYMAMLDRRLKRMEDRVIKMVPKESEATSIPRAVVRPPIASTTAKSPKKSKKRLADEAFGTQYNLETWSRNDDEIIDDTATKLAQDHGAIASVLMREGVEALPSKDMQIHLGETYFDYVYGQSYPILHKPTFMRDLDAGTLPPVLILAVCAVSARFSNHPQLRTLEPAFLRGEEWAAVARDISTRHYDSPSVTILNVYLLLALHEFGTCHGGRSWMFGGLAQRLALMMQLHKEGNGLREASQNGEEAQENVELNRTEREMRRRLLWSCFTMDRFTSSGSDRPICFVEECITTPLPIKESMFLMEIAGDTERLDGSLTNPLGLTKPGSSIRVISRPGSNLGVHAYIVKLVAIWGRLVNFYNLGGRLREKVPMWHPSSKFQELAQSLKKFQFPKSMQWSEDNLESHRAQRLDNQFVYMHIIYHHIRLFLYRFAIPGYGAPIPQDIPQSFQAESQSTALDAANEVSRLIELAMACNVTSPFAGYAAFYASTVHIQGAFAKNAQIANRARKNLSINIRFLSQMQQWWGMYHFMLENLKVMFRKQADNFHAQNGPLQSDQEGATSSSIFQFGDWFDKYPSGVSNTGFQKAASNGSKSPYSGTVACSDVDSLAWENYRSDKNKFPSERDVSGTQPMIRRVTDADDLSRPIQRPKLSMNTNVVEYTIDGPLSAPAGSHHPHGNPYFPPTNLNIPTDSFASATSFLPTANHPMSMRPPAQQVGLAQGPTPNEPGESWFTFQPESSRNISGAATDPLKLSNLNTTVGGEWFIPWAIEPPPGLMNVPMDVTSAGGPGLGVNFDSWANTGYDGGNGKRPMA